jgi:hypothetical protein
MKEIAEGAARERGQRLAASAEVDFYQDICCLSSSRKKFTIF